MYSYSPIIETIITRAREYGATKLILFGSAMENPTEAHDLDLACDGIAGWKLYEFAGRLENELRILLDIIPLSPATPFTQYIEQEGKILL
jgi:predicted nucleotidyltransferase